MHVAISFCNQENTHSQPNLVILNPETGQCHYVKTDTPDRGFTGLAQDSLYLYALWQPADPIRQNTGLVVLDKSTLEVSWHAELPNVKDPHSIAIDKNGDLYVVSTGTEQILLFKIDLGSRTAVFKREVWHPYTRSQQWRAAFRMSGRILRTGKKRWFLRSLIDRSLWSTWACRNAIGNHHVNSIFIKNEELFVSAFGLHAIDLKTHVRNGYIYNITRDQLLVEDVYHPHSVHVSNGDVFFCESAASRVKCGIKDVLTLDFGYVRGLFIHNGLLFVGISSMRKRSKSTGAPNKEARAAEPICKLQIYRFESRQISRQPVCEVDFTTEYSEIYDVLPWNTD